MSTISRRKFVTGGLAAAAGVSSLAVASRLSKKYGLVPPDSGGIYGPGETLTYAAQQLLARHSVAREFPRSMISKVPFANAIAPLSDEFKRLEAGGFAGWQLSIQGMVARPGAFSLANLRTFPVRSQITEVVCEEGWSYIAEWIGTPLSSILESCGILPQARYIVYFSIQPDWWDSVDMADALHPQTLLTYAMNDADLPVSFGGPLRPFDAVSRRLARHHAVTRVMATDSLKGFVSSVEPKSPNFGYAWYAGI